MVSFTLIVAATRTNGIGRGSRLPWRLPAEMAYFARITKVAPSGHRNIVIMGRKTWESIPKSKRPLVDRTNVVITSNPDYDLGPNLDTSPPLVKTSLDAALSQHVVAADIHHRFIIGGASLYKEALALEPISSVSPVVDRIILTRILSPLFEDCDVFFPEFRDSPGWRQVSHADLEAWAGFKIAEGVQKENGIDYEFQMWVRDAQRVEQEMS